jgi:hypothetical protein
MVMGMLVLALVVLASDVHRVVAYYAADGRPFDAIRAALAKRSPNPVTEVADQRIDRWLIPLDGHG